MIRGRRGGDAEPVRVRGRADCALQEIDRSQGELMGR